MADLEVVNVTKEFPGSVEPLQVLRGVSLELSQGDNLAVVGPSGSGKSTLLHIMGALDRPTSGEVRLNGEKPFELPERQLAAWRNDNIGFIFQEHHLLPQLSVIENVLLPAVAHGAVTKEQQDRAAALVERVGLEDRQDHRPAELSGGERQRAAVARALMRSPALVLADEPTGSLDEENAATIAQLLLELQAKSMLVVVTHSMELAAQLQRQVRFRSGLLEQRTPAGKAQ